MYTNIIISFYSDIQWFTYSIYLNVISEITSKLHIIMGICFQEQTLEIQRHNQIYLRWAKVLIKEIIFCHRTLLLKLKFHSLFKYMIDGFIDFKGMSNHLTVFHTKTLGNRVHTHIFCIVISEFFFHTALWNKY